MAQTTLNYLNNMNLFSTHYLESEEVAEHDVHWARREVVRHCIFGVDLNPMAVELAKLSLWLETVAANKPLTFLDHHLKVGNSLIGAKVADLKTLPSKEKKEAAENGKKQLKAPTLWDFTVKKHFEELLAKYGEFAAHPDDDLKSVKLKEQEYDALQKSEINRRLYELANVWVSTYFGASPPPDEYAEMQNEMNPKDFQDWGKWRGRDWFRRAQETAEEKRFFYWELEFPERFYEKGAPKENPGWDVVVGNPPYGASFDLIEKDYIMNSFETVAWRGESYIAFIELALNMCCKNGYTSMIVPDTWMSLKFTEDVRTLFFTSGSLKQIVALPTNVFEDAAIDTSIYVLEKKIINKNIQKIEFSSETYVTAYPKDASIDSIDTKTEIVYNQLAWAKNTYKILNPHATPYQLQILNKMSLPTLKGGVSYPILKL